MMTTVHCHSPHLHLESSGFHFLTPVGRYFRPELTNTFDSQMQHPLPCHLIDYPELKASWVTCNAINLLPELGTRNSVDGEEEMLHSRCHKSTGPVEGLDMPFLSYSA
jgi:hypothetical protein